MALTKRFRVGKRHSAEMKEGIKGSGLLFNNDLILKTTKTKNSHNFNAKRHSMPVNNYNMNRLLNPANSMTTRRVSQHKLLPLGGVLGERVAKSIIMHDKAC